MASCVTLSRHTRELSYQGVCRIVDEFTPVDNPYGPRLLVRLNRSTGEIDARIVSGTARGRDLRLWVHMLDATPGDVARLLFALMTGAYRTPVIVVP